MTLSMTNTFPAAELAKRTQLSWCIRHESDGKGGLFHFSSGPTVVIRAHSNAAGQLDPNAELVSPSFDLDAALDALPVSQPQWQVLGWSNRETRAAFCYISDGLNAASADALSTAIAVEGHLTYERGGDILAAVMQRYLDELADARLTDEYGAIREDLGAPGAVDWAEVAGTFLDWTGVQSA